MNDVYATGQLRKMLDRRIVRLQTEAFEAWHRKRWPGVDLWTGTNVLIDTPGPRYVSQAVQDRWSAWWAALQQERVTVGL